MKAQSNTTTYVVAGEAGEANAWKRNNGIKQQFDLDQQGMTAVCALA